MTKTIAIDTVQLGARQRKHIDKSSVDDLAESIKEKGLLHPIVCVQEGEVFRLIAGERRLRAIQSLSQQNRLYSHDGTVVPPGEIPYVLINSDLDDIQLREAELEENIIRVDLSWQDRVAALDELHELRLARNPKQTASDTAREIEEPTGLSADHSRRVIAQSRFIAPHLDDPEVSNAKDITQAFRIVTKKLEAELSSELARRGKSYKSAHTLIQGDFLEITQYHHLGLPDGFSCIIADPPYGMGADQFGDAAQHAHTYKDDPSSALEIVTHIIDEGYSLAAEDAHLYLFCDIEHFCTIRDIAQGRGWSTWRTPLVWYKTSASAHAPTRNRGFRRSYELVLFASKGDKPFAQVYSDVWEIASLREKDVAAQKPTELYTTMLRRSCFPGDMVLDPCCGSGTIFKAAEDLNLRAWGVEKDESACAIAQLTLSSLKPNDDEEE